MDILSYLDEGIDDYSQRSAKFTEDEIKILLELVKKKQDILMCKKTGKVTPKQREEAWEEVTVQFNSSAGVQFKRTLIQLKNKWDYMKRSSRKEAGNFKKNLKKTGGGPPPSPLSEPTLYLLDKIGDSIQGSNSRFDSDKALSSPIKTKSPVNLAEDLPVGIYEVVSEEDSDKEKNIENIENKGVPRSAKRKKVMKKIPGKENKKDTAVTPEFTRSKFVELAKRKLSYVDYKEKERSQFKALEMEIVKEELELKKLQRKEKEEDLEIKRLQKQKLLLEIELIKKQVNPQSNQE